VASQGGAAATAALCVQGGRICPLGPLDAQGGPLHVQGTLVSQVIEAQGLLSAD
jgi:hypothetical protein